MGIYWCVIDEYEKKYFESPEGFSIKRPGIFHPSNPFPGMVIMMNSKGFHFELVNDMGYDGPYGDHASEYENITEKVYQEYLDYFEDENEPIQK